MTICAYICEQKNGLEDGNFGVGPKGLMRAIGHATRFNLRVIEIQYEFADSEMIHDFTENENDW